MAGPLYASSPPESPRADDFFSQLGLARTVPERDVWGVAESPPANWMTAAGPVAGTISASGTGADFQQLLDRVSEDGPRLTTSTDHWNGLNRDPGWWRYRVVRTESLYRLATKLELPDPFEVRSSPFGGRDWKAEEKMQIPVPIPVPVAEQLFVYGQFNGSGDALNNQMTALTGKTGLGLKWSLLWKTELQLKYGALFNYPELYGPTRGIDRAKPAVEVVATVPLIGPWQLEYTGAALPAVSRADPDQIRQELRLAFPLRGDGEFEFGARYRWEDGPLATPWLDRAQLFLGVKFRH